MINLTKGQVIDLTKKEETLKHLNVGLGWQTRMDLDAIAFLLDGNNKHIETVSFMDKESKNKSVRLSGDDLVGGGVGDNETIYIDLDRLNPQVKTIALYANIFKFLGFSKKTFKDVENAYIRVVNRDNKNQICKYSLTEDGARFDAFHFADITKVDGEWKFRAVGNGCNGSINKLRNAYL